MKRVFVDRIASACGELGICLSEVQLEQFYQYYELLIERNKVMNLTAITEWEDVIYKHFIDSLSLVKVESILEDSNKHFIDVGTGAGFPGIPLKIAFPDIEIILLDSLHKRVDFLKTVIDNLGLKKIEALHGRAEDKKKKKNFREQFDLCVSRAVANLSTLIEYCLPFVKKDGLFISYKSGKIEEELSQAKTALKILGGEIMNTITFQLPRADGERCLIKIKKVRNTPNKYPRKSGLPGKEPLR